MPTNIVQGALRCCGLVVPNDDKYACPNCNGTKKAKRTYANQTPSGQNKLGPSADRWKERSRTYQGIATAFAEQWGREDMGGGLCASVTRDIREPAIRDLFAADIAPSGMDGREEIASVEVPCDYSSAFQIARDSFSIRVATSSGTDAGIYRSFLIPNATTSGRF